MPSSTSVTQHHTRSSAVACIAYLHDLEFATVYGALTDAQKTELEANGAQVRVFATFPGKQRSGPSKLPRPRLTPSTARRGHWTSRSNPTDEGCKLSELS